MSNYRSGADLERALVRQLREAGWEAARSAGSKSAIDVWAVRDGQVRLFQCSVRRTSAKNSQVAAATLKIGLPVTLVTRDTLESHVAAAA